MIRAAVVFLCLLSVPAFAWTKAQCTVAAGQCLPELAKATMAECERLLARAVDRRRMPDAAAARCASIVMPEVRERCLLTRASCAAAGFVWQATP